MAAKKNTPAAETKKDPQTSFTERASEDPEFEQALEELADEELADAAKELRRLRTLVKEKAAFHQLKEDEVLRVGGWRVVGKKRNGGGFSVPAWESITVGTIARDDS